MARIGSTYFDGPGASTAGNAELEFARPRSYSGSVSRPAPLLTVLVLVLGLLLGPGCRQLQRSQLLDPVLADDTLTRETLTALGDSPLQTREASRVTLEFRDRIWIYAAEFRIDPPAGFLAEMASTLGSVGLVASWDDEGAHLDGEPAEIRSHVQGLPGVIGLWLLGDCSHGVVLQGVNGLAVDCPAEGPDGTLTWRIWFDAERGLRLRGELLDDDSMIADYTCDPTGRCVLQDLVRGVAVRVTPL